MNNFHHVLMLGLTIILLNIVKLSQFNLCSKQNAKKTKVN